MTTETTPENVMPAPVGSGALVRRVLDYFRWKHRIESVDDIEITDIPGYWQIKAGCPGGENCRHASRIAGMCCDGTRPLTIYFAEHGVRDAQGRFVKPHRAWQAWRVNPPNGEVSHRSGPVAT